MSERTIGQTVYVEGEWQGDGEVYLSDMTVYPAEYLIHDAVPHGVTPAMIEAAARAGHKEFGPGEWDNLSQNMQDYQRQLASVMLLAAANVSDS